MPKEFKEGVRHLGPRWLKEAEVAAELMHQGRLNASPEPDVFTKIFAATGRNMASAKRILALQRFLLTEYSEDLERCTVRAGEYVIRELLQLHLLDSEAAIAIAPGVLQGDVSIRAIRNIIASTKQRASQPSEGARLASFNRGRNFVKHIISAVADNPSLVGLSNVQYLEIPKHRTPLMPDMVVHHTNGDQTAIEVKQGATAAAQALNVAGAYLARLAQLEQRYDRAILAMPLSAEAFAESMKCLQRTWADPQPNIILFDESTTPKPHQRTQP